MQNRIALCLKLRHLFILILMVLSPRIFAETADTLDTAADEPTSNIVCDPNQKRVRTLKPCGDETSAYFRGQDLSALKMNGILFSMADLAYANLNGVEINNAVLRSARLFRATLYTAQCKQADFRGADLNGASFNKAECSQADFRGMKATNTSFRNANLQKSRFNYLYCQGCNFQNADLRGADLTGGFILNSRFKGALFNSETRLPFSREQALEKGMNLQEQP